MAVAPTANAAPPNIVSNPGSFTISTVGGYIFIGKSGTKPSRTDFTNTIGPWQCNDGIDNNADGNIDGADPN